ncbi:hypothetical protein ASF99_04860 [Exiguobacterium sp. Leaf187]|uniref:hypothetical protein n=1 Tax=Exiguobacterium sp. Leaf187 TaxID=1736294 RepID=UPI0006FFC730|nr:hypothetical protein [Exiguobacterium sp. Leaf187]KQS19219.1 hypothetical protein ASF99_04860 [Exiguobacterium sp. Leaf187]
MTLFMKWGMFILSYIPLYFLLAIQHLKYKKIPLSVSELSSAWSENRVQFCFWLVLIMLFLVSIFMLIMFIRIFAKGGNSFKPDFTLKDVTNLQDNQMSYLLTYVVPLASINEISDGRSLLTNLFLFILIGKMYTQNNLIYVNPAFSIVGFSVFQANNKVYISRISREKLKLILIHEEQIYLRELGSDMYYLSVKD